MKFFTKLINIINNKYTRHLSSQLNLSQLSQIERIEYLRNMAFPKSRENPIIIKLDTPEFHSIFTDEIKFLSNLFKKYNYEIRVAGGAVRDLLMGVKPKDLDFATTATPSEMKDMFISENIRMINMNGEKHGTITPRINDKENFEITTLRIDVVCDGRHAEIQFTQDWMLDALRRDLTINSMFLGLDGSVYDYFYGYEHLKECKIKFVGDASTRIQEDYLRILRYFRFYGRIAKKSDSHEEETLNAICDNVEGLKTISGERIWTELKKILEGNYAGELLLKIIECGLSKYIGLSDNPNIEELKLVWNRCGNLKLNAITLLCSVLNTLEDVVQLHSRLKLSAYERDLALFIVENRSPKFDKNPLKPYQTLVLKSKGKINDTFEYVLEVLKYNNSPYLNDFQDWKIPKFPINGKILKENGVESGKIMGYVLNELKNIWIEDNEKSTDELLKHLPFILSNLEKYIKKK